MNSETKICQNCKKDFTVEAEDFDFYTKMEVPAPTWCPDCRFKRRLLWRNERNLFRIKDSLTSKEIFTDLPPSIQAPVYDIAYWRSDAFDARPYAREYDFSKSFFEQFRDLLYAVPWPSRSILDLVNSDYCTQAGNLRNCYLTFNADYCENVSYSVRIARVKDSFDVLDAADLELCYEATLCKDSFRIFFSFDCIESRDIWCSKDLLGCSDCVGSVGLRKKSYYIFNEPYSKEDYAVAVKKLRLDTYSGVQAALLKMRELAASKPVRYMRGTRHVDVTGDNILHSKNCHDCWGVNEGQDLKYSQMVYLSVSNSYDYTTWGGVASQMYESQTCGNEADFIRFCWECWPATQRLTYSMMCRSSSDLFGCVGMKKAQYCILNKQYSKEEYEELVPKIKQHMIDMPYTDKQGRVYGFGEFFPIELSPFGYNESQLQSFFPLDADAAREKGYQWHEIQRRDYKTTLRATELPDAIAEVGEKILEEVIECVQCARAYRIIPLELQFLAQQKIPLPRECPECRTVRREKTINPPVFYNRECQKCAKAIRTSYAPDRKEIVYCESCYQQEVA